MVEAIECVYNDEMLNLNNQDSKNDVLIELNKNCIYSDIKSLDLNQAIKDELNTLELQLYHINLKLKSSQEKVSLKKSQNEEIKTIINYYNLISEKKIVDKSLCTCTSKCIVF